MRSNVMYMVTAITIIVFSVFVNTATAEVQKPASADPGEKILGFSLANFDEKNKKAWDLEGETLEVFGDLIKLSPVKANVYGEEDTMVVVADQGTFNRAEGKVHLQDNVVITSQTGTKMMTETLDWLQQNQLVQTEDKVNISKDNIQAEGVGAVGKTDLQQFSLNKEVRVDIAPQPTDETMRQTTITCDGPLDIDYVKQTAIFNNNVEAFDGESQLFADKMTGYFDSTSKKLNKVIAEGNVKMIRGKDTAYGQQAIYDAEKQTVSLIGRPKLIIYSKGKSGESQDNGESQAE